MAGYLRRKVDISSGLKAIRRKYGLTQEQAAERLGCAPNTWGQWESKKYVLRMDWAVEIAEEFNVSLDWLIIGKGGEEVVPLVEES